MSTIEQEPMAVMPDQAVNSEISRPQPEGVFLSENPELPEEWQFKTRIYDISTKDSHRDRYGNLVTNHRLRMTDRAMYNLRVTHPLDADTDIAVFKTPAWSTNSRGHNERTGQELGRIGLPNIEVSALGEERDSFARELGRLATRPLATLRDLRDVSLARQAHVMLSVAGEADYFDLNAEYAFWFGESRGAMTAMGACALAPSHEVKIPFALAVAPCFEEGLSLETYREHRGQLRNELFNMAKLVGNVSLGRLLHYPNTLNLSPKSLMYEAAHAPTLFRGDAGKLQKHIPTEQHMEVLAFENDLAGQYQRWQNAFADYPNVNVRYVPGAHLSIADKRTMDHVTRAFDKVAEQLKNGTDAEELDYSAVKRPMQAVR